MRGERLLVLNTSAGGRRSTSSPLDAAVTTELARPGEFDQATLCVVRPDAQAWLLVTTPTAVSSSAWSCGPNSITVPDVSRTPASG